LPTMVPPRSGAAIVYLGIFGSVIGFALYYYVIKNLVLVFNMDRGTNHGTSLQLYPLQFERTGQG